MAPLPLRTMTAKHFILGLLIPLFLQGNPRGNILESKNATLRPIHNLKVSANNSSLSGSEGGPEIAAHSRKVTENATSLDSNRKWIDNPKERGQISHRIEENSVTTDEFVNNNRSAPRYMLSLYETFKKGRTSGLMADVVRSFNMINIKDIDESSVDKSIKGSLIIHRLEFNLSSLRADEEIVRAELRLYVIHPPTKPVYPATPRRLSIYHETLIRHQDRDVYYWGQLISKTFIPRTSHWETFSVSRALFEALKTGKSELSLEIRIDNGVGIHSKDAIDVEINPHNDNDPILVVFSNYKGTNRPKKDLDNSESAFGESEELSRKSHVRNLRNHRIKLRRTMSDIDTFYQENFPRNHQDGTNVKRRHGHGKDQHISRKKRSYTSMAESHKPRRRRKRGKLRRKPRRHICRREPMLVNFEDINWHNWVIAPRQYQAFECSGRCYFPLSAHLTPTKHAIIQTLLHTNYPRKAARACCVPTRLDPMSILYLDERGVVTFKYQYDNMVVAECGCR